MSYQTRKNRKARRELKRELLKFAPAFMALGFLALWAALPIIDFLK